MKHKLNTIISSEEIQKRIGEMANEIDKYYLQQEWYRQTEQPVIVVGVLTGSLFFMADLLRKLTIRTKLDFIRVSTYPGTSTTAQSSKIVHYPVERLYNTHILLIDDILDTGGTMHLIRSHLSAVFPASVKIAVLLRKPYKRSSSINGDFIGFDIQNKFVVGYGLNYGNKYRELPYIATLRLELDLNNKNIFEEEMQVRW